MLHRFFAHLARLTGARRALAAALLGVLSALALPPIHAVPLLLVAVPGLLTLLAGRSWRQAAAAGFWFGFGHHLVGLYWITEALLFEADRYWWLVPIAVPALSAVLALFMAVPCAVAALARPGAPRVLTLAGAWVLADLSRQFVLSGFPWNPLGSVWAMPGAIGDVAIQPAALLSVHGLTFATLCVMSLPVLGRRARQAVAVAVLGWVGFGLWHLHWPVAADPQLSVVLVQGNVQQGEVHDQASALSVFERHLDLTRQGVARAGAGSALVVWPETISPYNVVTDAGARAAIVEAAGVTSLIGSIRYDTDGMPRNSLVALQGPGRPQAVYDKAHLVPFGEYAPDWMPLAIQLVPGRGFGRGPGPVTMHLPGLPAIGPLICYEAIFPGEIVDEQDRPAFLVNVTNDAWFGTSTGPRQHLAAARLRAVEEGLPLMRAANTGVTAGFDAFGRELGRIGMMQSGVLVLHLPGALPLTMMSRLGLAGPITLAALALLLGLASRPRAGLRI
jgi:apolipoprotein N-acyltransferase